MAIRQSSLPHAQSWPKAHTAARPHVWGVAAVVLITMGMLSSAAHFTARASAARQRQSFEALNQHVTQLSQHVDKAKVEVKDNLDRVKQELKDALEQGSRGLYKQIAKSGAEWVRDSDVNQVVTIGAACTSNPPAGNSSKHNLQLNITDRLVAPIVVLAHARTQYLAKTVLTLHRHWSADPGNADKFPLFVSVDGDHQPTLILATSLQFAVGAQVVKVQRDSSSTACTPAWDAYCNLALHYKELLKLFFECLEAPRLILLEEDLVVAPDFFSYFEATAPLLDQDSSLYCISAWNDQGQVGRALNHTALYRTDVFPGLGWMLTRAVGLELLPTWPPGFWDDNHLRKPKIRKGRQCIYPEVPRTHTFGADGASNGMFFSDHLDNMIINTQDVDWTQKDLSYLLADRYAFVMQQWLSAAKPLTRILQGQKTSLKEYCNITQPPDRDTTDLYLTYKNNADFEKVAKQLAPMLFSVSGGAQVPRSVYNTTGHGAVIVRCRQRRLFLVNRAPQDKQIRFK